MRKRLQKKIQSEQEVEQSAVSEHSGQDVQDSHLVQETNDARPEHARGGSSEARCREGRDQGKGRISYAAAHVGKCAGCEWERSEAGPGTVAARECQDDAGRLCSGYDASEAGSARLGIAAVAYGGCEVKGDVSAYR